MTLTKFTSGTKAKSSEVNNNFAVSLKQSIINLIRQLQDRSVSFSADGGEWAEAYVDADGQLDSVDTGLTTAPFVTDKYTTNVTDEASGDATADPGSFTNVANAFDNDNSTYADKTESANGVTIDTSLGKTFSAKTVGVAYVKCSISTNESTGVARTAILQTYDGSTWNNVQTLCTFTGASSATFDGWVSIDSSVEGIRVKFDVFGGGVNATQRAYLYTLEYGDAVSTEITHDIPSGTFSSTISSSVGSALFEDWEAGANIQYKLTNATEDTGWLNFNEISTFTAFTSEPTKCIVKLVPKTTTPTGGYPAINGFGVIG